MCDVYADSSYYDTIDAITPHPYGSARHPIICCPVTMISSTLLNYNPVGVQFIRLCLVNRNDERTIQGRCIYLPQYNSNITATVYHIFLELQLQKMD